jgi:hypothetical protein
LDQRLRVAAAISTVMAIPPIVVGGTAEEYWTHDEYHPTDLDLIPGPSYEDEEAFRKLGFKKEGRHWVSDDFAIATEFPHDETFEVRRTADVRVDDVVVKVIGVDDLYLDRLGYSAMTENVKDRHFASLLAVAVANWSDLDWRYIENRIAETIDANPVLGKSMRLMHGRCRRRVRNVLATRRARQL